MYKTVLFEKNGPISVISLNRPEVMNAFDKQMHEDLYDAINHAAEDNDVRCIVLRGAGRGFSSGADLGSVKSEELADTDYGDYLKETYNRLLLRMNEIEKPIIAALHGPVFGAGLGIAMGCDLRIAATSSKYSMAFIKIGLMPDAGSSYFLPRLVGLGKAMELAMLGQTIDAEEAYRIGLINQVIADEELEQVTRTIALQLAESAPVALRWIKKTMYGSFDKDLAGVLSEEEKGQSVCGKTSDHLEGVTAFFEKRKPKYTGK